MILRTTIGAFTHAQETADAIEALREDRLFLRSTIVVQPGGIQAAVTYLAEHETPPILIVETDAEGGAMMEQLGRLADVCAPATRVVLIGRDNDITLYRTLIREGITDYIVGPADVDQLRQSFHDSLTEADAANVGRVIAFTGVRGGVGSSVIAHHTAFALSQTYGEQVIVVDLDIPYGTAALVFNIRARQTTADALSQMNRMDEVLLERFMVPYGPSKNKVSILPSPASLTAGIDVTTEGLNTILRLVRNMAGFVVLDLPHTWQKWFRELIVECDELVLVAEPDLACLRDMKNIVEFLGSTRGTESPTSLVLNRVGIQKRAELSEKEFRDTLGTSVDLVIPADIAAFSAALNNGELIFKTTPKSKVVKAINTLATTVSNRQDEDEKKKRLSLFKK